MFDVNELERIIRKGRSAQEAVDEILDEHGTPDESLMNPVMKATGQPCGHGHAGWCALCDTPGTTIMLCGHPLSELDSAGTEGTTYCRACRRNG